MLSVAHPSRRWLFKCCLGTADPTSRLWGSLTAFFFFRITGTVKATEAAEAWAEVLDRMENIWMTSSNDGTGDVDSAAPAPPLRVYMRLGALYNILGRMEEAKVREPA